MRRYYTVGMVDYTPRMNTMISGIADTNSPYELGEPVPIIDYIEHNGRYYMRRIYWMENTIEGLKPGDTVLFNLMEEKIYKLKLVEGLGIRIEGEEIE